MYESCERYKSYNRIQFQWPRVIHSHTPWNQTIPCNPIIWNRGSISHWLTYYRPCFYSWVCENTTPYECTLTTCPRSLFVIWQEYEFGVGGRKAAKTFSARERGRVKFKYCFRNHFWSLMKRMILRGYSHTSAIDKIYSVYGRNLSASKILYEIRKDSKNGGHPQLRWKRNINNLIPIIVCASLNCF